MTTPQIFALVTLVLLAIIVRGIVLILRFFSHDCSEHINKDFTFPITIFFKHSKITGGIKMVSIKYTQQVRGVLGSPVDAKGNEAPVEAGSVKITSSDETVFTVEADDEKPNDPVAFKIVAKKPGVARLDYSADADLGEGVKEISGFMGVEVLPGEAVGFGAPIFAAVEEQPETGGETGGGEEGGGDEGGEAGGEGGEGNQNG